MTGGMEIRAAHFPARAPIDAYGNGGFRFADMSHRGSVLCLPSGIYGWKPQAETPDATDLARVFAEAAEIALLLIGTGEKMRALAPQLAEQLREAGIAVEVMSTGAAVRSYNVLLSEGRSVAAALYATE